MKYKLFFLIVVLIPSFTHAQKSFRNGFVVTHQGDTLRGLIKYTERTTVYDVCTFKKTADQAETTYAVKDIRAYGLDGFKAFEAMPFIRSGKYDSAFLEVLVKGKVSLYRYGPQFLINKDGGALQPLTNEKNSEYVITNENKHLGRVMLESNKHIVTLNMMMSDCAEVRPKIQKILLAEKALIRLINDYHRCMGAPAAKVTEKQPRMKALIGLSAGVGISNITFQSAEPINYHLLGDFEQTTSPLVGLSFDFVFPRSSERIAILSGVYYTSSSFKRYFELSDANSFETNKVSMKVAGIYLPFGVRYTFPGRIIRPYLNFGSSFLVITNESSSWLRTQEIYQGVRYTDGKALDFKGYSIGLWGGVGMAKPINKKFDATIEIRYERTDGFEESVFNFYTIESKVSHLQFLVGLRLK